MVVLDLPAVTNATTTRPDASRTSAASITIGLPDRGEQTRRFFAALNASAACHTENGPLPGRRHEPHRTTETSQGVDPHAHLVMWPEPAPTTPLPPETPRPAT